LIRQLAEAAKRRVIPVFSFSEALKISTKNMLKRIVNYFDKLEDKVRHRLSRQPILYAFIGGTGVIIFWRGVWHLNDFVVAEILKKSSNVSAIGVDSLPWWDGASSVIAGGAMLLITGILVPSFIGNEVIISGIRKEKKIAEKTEEEVETELEKIKSVEKEMKTVIEKLSGIEEKIV